jgi:protein TonB
MSSTKHVVLKIVSLSLLVGWLATLQAATSEGTEYDTRATPVKTPPPDYPGNLKIDGISGVVAVKVIIDESGTVIECSVTKSSNVDFDQSAIAAVKNWKFTPALKGGSPVKSRMVIPIHFRIDE